MQGLSDIQIVPIDLQDRPTWYKEKVYAPNKVGLHLVIHVWEQPVCTV